MTTTLIIIYFIGIALLIVCSAFFSMSETAFTSVSEVRLKKLANDGDKRAEKALAILGNYDKLLTTILIGNNIVNIGATTIATLVFAVLLGQATGSVVSTVVMTLLVLTFGEILPKTAAKKRPERYVLKLVSVVNAVEVILSPLSWVFGKVTSALSRRMGGDDSATMTEDELEVAIDGLQDDGVIEKSEGELIKSAIRFDDTPVSEVYTPRMDVVALDINSTVSETGKLFSESGFSRIPVYDGTIDNIIGVAYAKQFYAHIFNKDAFTLSDIVSPVKYVPETMSIASVFNEFQKSKVHLAVVLDSYGGTMGIVTLEDILEELVGEIWDESDEIQPDFVRQTDGSLLAKGKANIYDAAEALGAKFDPGDYEDYSVMGYLFYRLNRVPQRGDTVTDGNIVVTVKTVKGRRPAECVISKVAKPEESEEEKDKERAGALGPLRASSRRTAPRPPGTTSRS